MKNLVFAQWTQNGTLDQSESSIPHPCVTKHCVGYLWLDNTVFRVFFKSKWILTFSCICSDEILNATANFGQDERLVCWTVVCFLSFRMCAWVEIELRPVMEAGLNCSSHCESGVCFIYPGVNIQQGWDVLQRLCALAAVHSHPHPRPPPHTLTITFTNSGSRRFEQGHY